MRSDLFQHELGKTSAVFGRKNDVTVVFQGEGAATDGSTIILPALDQNADVSEDMAAIMRGYVDHEAGHVRHSDFGALKRFADECSASGDNLTRAVHNALEDVWLERRVREEYRGAERNLRATATAVNKQFLANVKAGDERLRDDKFVTAVAITWEGRKDYGGETCAQCLDMLDDELRQQLPKWVSALDACRNSTDVITLAKAVAKSVRDQDYRDEPQQPSNGEGESDEHGDDQDQGNSAGDETARGGDDQEGTEQRSQGEGDGRSGDGRPSADGRDRSEADRDEDGRVEHGASDSAEGGAPSEECVYEDFDVGDALKRELGESGLTSSGAESYRALSTKDDIWHHRTDTERYEYGRSILSKGTASAYDAIKEGMQGDVNVMRRKLERALVAKQNRDWDVGREFGRLDVRRLTSAVAGRTNVFKMRTDRAEIDTAVTFLVDMSGSMAGREIKLARDCVVGMVEAIDRTGICYEVLGFNNTRAISGASEDDLYSGKYGRVERMDMWIFKSFEERLFEAKGAICQMASCAGGNNADGDAVRYAYSRLSARPQTRKVMVVLSDGFPATSAGCSGTLYSHLRSAVDMMGHDGVECIGIGIYSDAVSRFYPRWVVVNDLSELAGAAMDQISRVLLGERFQIDNSKLMAVAHV